MTSYEPRSLNLDEIRSQPVLEEMSVVIPTLGRPILEESLYWLANGSAWPGCLIIVDQGSNRKVSHWIAALQSRGMNVRHIRSEPCGPAAAVNLGLERVETPLIAITDDDCFVDQHWLENAARLLSINPEAAITGRVEAGRENVFHTVTSLSPSTSHRPHLLFDTMSRGNMAASAAVFRRVGLFDEDLRAAEDAEWAYRALRTGVPIIYAPEFCIRHYEWRDEDRTGAKYEVYAYHHGLYYGKYLRRGDLFIAVRSSLHLLRALRRWLLGFLGGDAERTELGRAYFLGLMPGILAGVRRGANE